MGIREVLRNKISERETTPGAPVYRTTHAKPQRRPAKVATSQEPDDILILEFLLKEHRGCVRSNPCSPHCIIQDCNFAPDAAGIAYCRCDV